MGKSNNNRANGSSQLQRRINRRRRKRRKKIIIIVMSIILALLIVVGVAGFFAYSDVKSIKSQATEMKADLETSVSCIKEQDYSGAQDAMDNVEVLSREIRETINKPIWKMLSVVPFVGKNITAASDLLEIVGDANESIITPFIGQMASYPLSQLKVEDGFDVGTVISYINFAEEMDPQINDLVTKIDEIEPRIEGLLKMIDSEGKMSKYTDSLVGLSDKYNDLKDYLPVFKAFLGNGTDRLYLMAAQNSTEIRAGGGFPGSIGTLEIQGGILKVGEFQSVYNVFPEYTPDSVELTGVESALFDDWMIFPRDAEYNPDFGRVGEVWAAAYEALHYQSIDGVISMSPVVIQEILGLCGEITLSDGTVLNGENATKILQHDMYYKYFSKGADEKAANAETDALFAETAKKTMDLFESGFSFDKAKDYFTLFSEGAAKRTIMLWMADVDEENIMIESGCSGVLNPGVNNAVAGAYFSVNDAQKLGWFLDLNTEVLDQTANDDGTTTYYVRVTFNNTLSGTDRSSAGTWILGGHNGAMKSFVHFFAPVGGTISDFNASNGMYIKEAEYQGLQVGYSIDVMLYPNSPIEVTYYVTTAADVEEPLTFSTTPTLQNYR